MDKLNIINKYRDRDVDKDHDLQINTYLQICKNG